MVLLQTRVTTFRQVAFFFSDCSEEKAGAKRPRACDLSIFVDFCLGLSWIVISERIDAERSIRRYQSHLMPVDEVEFDKLSFVG